MKQGSSSPTPQVCSHMTCGSFLRPFLQYTYLYVHTPHAQVVPAGRSPGGRVRQHQSLVLATDVWRQRHGMGFAVNGQLSWVEKLPCTEPLARGSKSKSLNEPWCMSLATTIHVLISLPRENIINAPSKTLAQMRHCKTTLIQSLVAL